MKTIRRWLLAITASFVICSLFPLPKAHAEEGFSLATSPLPVRLITDPGKTVSTDLRVKNNGLKAERVKIGLMKFGATKDLGQPTLEDRGANDSYFDWVHFSQQTFDAPPNEWVTIKMSITVPPTAALGYYYAVTFSRANSPAPTGNHTAVVGSTASLILLQVNSPNTRRDIDLIDVSSHRRVYEFLPAELQVKLRNQGNIHLSPTGNIFISRGGKQVAVLDINAAGGNILPHTNRVFTVGWNDGFPHYIDKIVDEKPVYGSDGRPKRTLSWNFSDISKIRFGKYTAHVLVVYTDGQKDIPLEAVLSFWVVPWRIIFGIVTILLLMGFGLWTISRGTWRRLRPKPEHGHGSPKD